MNKTVRDLVNVPEIPSAHISINPDYIQKVVVLEQLLSQYPAIVTNDDCAAVNSLSVNARETARMLETRRVEAKEPVLALGKMIDAAVKPLMERAKAITARTDAMLLGYKRELEAKAAEQARLQAEEQARQDALREQARTQGISSLPDICDESAPIPQPVQAIVEVPAIAVTTVRRKVLKIYDRLKIPNCVTNAAGVTYWLLIPDEARIKDAIKAGCLVPGCEIVEEEGVRGR
jgi:hypothetical protein